MPGGIHTILLQRQINLVEDPLPHLVPIAPAVAQIEGVGLLFIGGVKLCFEQCNPVLFEQEEARS